MMLRSVGDQEADARAWCDREGWEVVGIETDANRSATQWARREREGFNRVLARIARQEIDVLVMWEASRGAREMQGFIDLKAALVSAGVLLAYGGKVYDLSRGDDVFAASLDALLAEREASGIRDRIVRTVRIRAEKGTPHGPVPYGYRRLYDDRTGALLKQIPDPETAPIVREITRRILVGETISAIARDLNHRGIATPKPPRKPELSRGWLAKTVSQLVLTPAIVGLRQHRGEIAGTASWEGLISRQDWDRIGQMFRDPARQTHRGPATMHLLSWIVRCGSCGTAMVAAVQRGKPRGLSCRNDMCTHRVYIDEAMTDIYVTDVITAWLSTPQTLAALRQSEGKDAPNVDISALGEQLGILEVRLADAAAKYIDGELSAGMLATVERGLQPQIDSLRRQIAPSPAPVDPEDVLQASNPAEFWLQAPLETKRNFIRRTFDIRITPTASRGGGRRNPERIRISRLSAPA